MAKCGYIKLTQASMHVGNFDLLADSTGSGVIDVTFETGISRLQLVTGDGFYSIQIPDNATKVRVQSDDVCTNYIDITISPPILTSYSKM